MNRMTVYVWQHQVETNQNLVRAAPQTPRFHQPQTPHSQRTSQMLIFKANVCHGPSQ
ncbi:hypothetical protein BDN71DRAFT_1452716 [Pleurotus eryngii]|uniref:Uncharacterized protein n=1 Tax=Pleurotus eryngii TaxID=5323 RepID=A0A9P6DDA1_PLEER|nr:hypothetical protein BDN71DRAFT_1452716 [Pleurotus eryngii]